nr:DUF4386 family protein [Candidatus Njordarchaeota archaeon]
MTKTQTIFDAKEKKSQNAGTSWKNLCRVGGIAAIVAAVGFRRNLGAEASLFTAQLAPTTAAGWFTLLQNDSLLGLVFLNIFDIVNYALVGVMFLSLYAALRKTNRSCMAITASLSFVGILIYVVSNTAFSILSLSSQYTSATTDAQRSTLLAAGEAVLAEGDPGAIYAGTGGYISLFLLAAAGLITSAIMIRSKIFNRATAYAGIVASVFDLTYVFGSVFVPETDVLIFSSSLMSGAGLLLFVWHLLVGLRLCKLGTHTAKQGVMINNE